MSDLLEIQTETTLYQTVPEVLLLTESTQGPPGPVGPAGSGPEKARSVDYTDPLYAYLGYADRIVRIDYSQSPPLAQSAPVADLPASWPLRTGLTYA